MPESSSTTITTTLFTTRRIQICILLITSLIALYLVSYSARIQSGDSLRFFDAGSSLARYGDTYLDESFWSLPPTIALASQPYPLESIDTGSEIFNVQLIALIYRLVDTIPEIGYVHAVWLINIIMAALTGGILFWYVLLRGYTDIIALLTAISFGAGTLVWAYSKTLFREPQVMLWLIIAAFCLEIWRQRGYFKHPATVIWGIAGIISFLIAMQFKETAIFALPALLILVLPFESFIQNRLFRQLNYLLLFFAISIPVIFVFVPGVLNTVIDLIKDVLARAGADDTQYVQTALHTYLFSLGGSIWGTSPVILLSIPGAVWLWQKRQYQQVWLALLILMTYAFGHAFLTEQHWFGGLSWSPRFLLPTLPFLILLFPPFFEKAQKHRGLFVIFAAVFFYALWIQFTAITLPWTHYASLLPPEANQLSEWSSGLNSLEYLRWVLLWGEWEHLGLDFAWTRSSLDNWMWIYLVLTGIVVVFAFFAATRQTLSRYFILLIWLYEIAFIALVFFSFRDLYWHDMLYNQNPELHTVMNILEADAIPGDMMLLADDTYAEFIMNNDRLEYPRTIILPAQPGERPDSDEPAEISSHSPVDLLTLETVQVLDHLALTQERIWLLAHTGNFHDWSIRPVERYLASRHYLLREYPTSDPTVRLLLFDLTPAPQQYTFRNPIYPAQIQFGDAITLSGFDLPDGTIYQPGDTLPITFSWQVAHPIEQDYTIAWFIAREDAAILPLQGIDSAPAAGFMPFTAFVPGIPAQDNRAISLPDTLPSGTYQLWVKIYWQSDTGLQELPATGQKILDDTIAVLPLEIEITAKN